MTKFFAILILLSFGSVQADELQTFKDFGERPGLVKVVDDLMINLLSNEKTKPFFEKADQANIKEKLVEQFCVELGGPCTYTGQTMKKAHKGHDINSAHFFGLVEALQEAMIKNRIPQRAQNKLLAKLAPMHKEIINK